MHALAPIADRVAAERVEAASDNTAGRVRTFHLQPSLIKGGDVQAFQRVINQCFAGLRIGRRIAENGVYGPNTRKAAHQVAFCLGLITTDLEDGITPAVRVVLRSPSRRKDIVVREAKRSSLPVSLVCAIVEKESGFRNVFGHDPTIFVGAGTVTKEKYLAYKQQHGPRGKGGMQGVGPCQLTWWTLQDRADVLGGCWMPGPKHPRRRRAPQQARS